MEGISADTSNKGQVHSYMPKAFSPYHVPYFSPMHINKSNPSPTFSNAYGYPNYPSPSGDNENNKSSNNNYTYVPYNKSTNMHDIVSFMHEPTKRDYLMDVLNDALVNVYEGHTAAGGEEGENENYYKNALANNNNNKTLNNNIINAKNVDLNQQNEETGGETPELKKKKNIEEKTNNNDITSERKGEKSGKNNTYTKGKSNSNNLDNKTYYMKYKTECNPRTSPFIPEALPLASTLGDLSLVSVGIEKHPKFGDLNYSYLYKHPGYLFSINLRSDPQGFLYVYNGNSSYMCPPPPPPPHGSAPYPFAFPPYMHNNSGMPSSPFSPYTDGSNNSKKFSVSNSSNNNTDSPSTLQQQPYYTIPPYNYDALYNNNLVMQSPTEGNITDENNTNVYYSYMPSGSFGARALNINEVNANARMNHNNNNLSQYFYPPSLNVPPLSYGSSPVQNLGGQVSLGPPYQADISYDSNSNNKNKQSKKVSCGC